MDDSPTTMDHNRHTLDLIRAALDAASPGRAVRRHFSLEKQILQVGEDAYDLAAADRLVVVGAGKAGAGMASAVEDILGDRIAAGWVNVRRGYEPTAPLRRIHIHPAAHPLPDEDGLEGARHILKLVDSLGEGDLALVLLSGGASALLVQPVDGVSLSDLQGLTDALLRSGATIEEVNTVRKHLSQVKGGRLARRIVSRGARAAVLVLSDVVGNPLHAIGSGPCAPDPTTFVDAWAVLRRYDLIDEIPPAAHAHLTRGRRCGADETPKPGDPLFEQVRHVIVGDNRAAAQAAVEQAEALGYNACLLTSYLEGEAREVGRFLASLGKEIARHGTPISRPACLVLGGETTVTVRGSGRGGRNQEVALGAALALDGWEGIEIVTLATDGTDGPTDAAGAIANGTTAARARALELDPVDHLARNDAYPLFAALGDLIVTGPTGTNVCDLAFVICSV
jgi:hydroxypyruvate reductase